MFIPSSLLECWKLLQGGDCIPYVVSPISLKSYNPYLSVLLLKNLTEESLRKGDAGFLYQGSKQPEASGGHR